MLKDNERYCEGCRQKLPAMSKLSRATLPQEDAGQSGWTGDLNNDGTVTIDLCLRCQIERAERLKLR
jgi:hypothetical protein